MEATTLRCQVSACGARQRSTHSRASLRALAMLAVNALLPSSCKARRNTCRLHLQDTTLEIVSDDIQCCHQEWDGEWLGFQGCDMIDCAVDRRHLL